MYRFRDLAVEYALQIDYRIRAGQIVRSKKESIGHIRIYKFYGSKQENSPTRA